MGDLASRWSPAAAAPGRILTLSAGVGHGPVADGPLAPFRRPAYAAAWIAQEAARQPAAGW